MRLEDVKILCVDDSSMVHKFLQTKLQKSYPNLYFASNGVEGVEKYKAHQPDIVISDINMPRMNGLEMLKKIKSINPQAVVVMMTTESSNSFVIQAAEDGASGYVNKNSARNDIKPTVDKLAKIIVEQANKPQEKKDPYEYLQPFLELSDEMTLLSDGVNILSCNRLFLDFLEVDSVYDFVANYASIEYLVESVEGIDDKILSSNHWIDFLLDVPEGREVVILNYQSSKREKLIAKVVKLPNEESLYAIVFLEKKEAIEPLTKSKEATHVALYNPHMQTLSEELFSAQLPLYLENCLYHDVAITIISLRVGDIEAAQKSSEDVAKITQILHQNSEAKDLLFSFAKGFLLVCIDSDIAQTKLKAKKIADTIKSFYAPQRLVAKLGFIALNNVKEIESETTKVMEYLKKFHAVKLV